MSVSATLRGFLDLVTLLPRDSNQHWQNAHLSSRNHLIQVSRSQEVLELECATKVEVSWEPNLSRHVHILLLCR